MAVVNFSGLTISNPQVGVQITKVTDSSSDWASVSNGTYFYDKSDSLVHYKNSSGVVLELFDYNYWLSGSTGTSSLKVKNGTTNDATGNYSISLGSGSKAIGDYSHAEGLNTTASGTSAHAEGYVTRSLGNFGAHSEGRGTTAVGDTSHAQGRDTKAFGDYSHTEGYLTTALGDYSHSGGNNSISSGTTSLAWGNGVQSNGGISVALGNVTQANGNTSFVFGYNSHANADGAIVLGWSLTGSTANHTYVESLNINAVGSSASVNDIRIDANGFLTTNTSDERLKENIQPLNSTLDIVKQLQGVTYQWKDRSAGGNDIKLGFVAQQVESIEPKLVFTNKVDGYKGIHIDGIIPLLVEAIKEQQQIIDNLNNRLNDLENK